MVNETGDVDVLTSSLSPAENVAAFAETSLVGREANGPLVTDGVPIQIVSEADRKVGTGKGGEGMNFGVSNDGGDVNEEEKGAADEGRGGDNVDFNDEDEDGEEEEDDVDDDYDDDDDYDEHEDFFMEEDDVVEDEGGLENRVDDIGEDKVEVNFGIEIEKKENKENGGVSLEPKVEKFKQKKVMRNNSDKVIVINQGKSERDEKNDPMDEGKGNEKEEVGEKGEGGLKKNIKRLRERDGKKVITGSSEKAASEPKDKLNSKRRKKSSSKRAESMGMIFMCSSKTKKDCYHYKVLGLPAGKRDVVEKIYKGMRLFLYDVDLKLMYGIYKAAGRGGYNIEPKAFNSKFPSQVRFVILEDCIPLAEEQFRKVIKENYFTKNKFDCQLNHEQVKNLCKLFIAASKGPKYKRPDRRHKAKAQASILLDRSRAQGVDEGRHRNRSRAQGVDAGRRIALDENNRNHDYFHVRQREVVAPPVARVSQVAPLPPPIASPRYVYDGTLEREAYRSSVLVEYRDPYRQPHLVSRDAYRQQPLSNYRDAYRPEPPLDRYDAFRRDRVPEHSDPQPINLEVRRRDDIAAHEPYYYRERESYREPVYIEHHLEPEPEPNRYRSLRTEYRSRGAPISEYRSTTEPEPEPNRYRSLRTEYRSRGARISEYRSTTEPEPDRYRSLRTDYRSRGAPISEYRSTRALHRY